jgi:hypothetical protein
VIQPYVHQGSSGNWFCTGNYQAIDSFEQADNISRTLPDLIEFRNTTEVVARKLEGRPAYNDF